MHIANCKQFIFLQHAYPQLGVAHSGKQLHIVVPLEAEFQTMNIIPPKRRSGRRKKEFESSNRWSLESVPNQWIYLDIFRLPNWKKNFEISLVTNKSMYFFPSQNLCPGHPEWRSSVKDSKSQQFRIGQRHGSPLASAGSARKRHGETPKRSAFQFQVAPVPQATERGDQLFWKSRLSWRLPSTTVRKSCSNFLQRVMA